MISSHINIFDRTCQRQHRARAAVLGPSTFLIDRAAEDLSDRLAAVLRHFDYVLDLGTPTDAARRALASSGKVEMSATRMSQVAGPSAKERRGEGMLDLIPPPRSGGGWTREARPGGGNSTRTPPRRFAPTLPFPGEG